MNLMENTYLNFDFIEFGSSTSSTSSTSSSSSPVSPASPAKKPKELKELKELKRVRNITSLNLLPDIPPKFFSPDYTIKRKVHNDELIEQISFDLYQSTDYWDILLVLNGMTSMNQLPVNNDIVIIKAEKKLQEWKDKGALLNIPMTSALLLKKYNEFLLLEETLNEKYRYINYISPEDMSELLADIEANKTKAKINKSLIINI